MSQVQHFLFLLLFCIPLYFSPAQAQTVHFQMNVEPEISADVLQDLNFGQFVVGSGEQHIPKGSNDAGIFRIKGLANQKVLVTLDIPEYLSHSTSSEGRIPVSLQAAYNNTLGNQRSSRPIESNHTSFSLRINNTGSQDPWAFAYVYMYGTTTIGDVPEGDYTAQIVLRVEYQ